MVIPIGDEPSGRGPACVVYGLTGTQTVEADGEDLTLLSAMFMHGSWLHIVGNMLYLWIFGDRSSTSSAGAVSLSSPGIACASQWAEGLRRCLPCWSSVSGSCRSSSLR